MPDEVSPLVRRVVAHNPNPFTFTGTGIHLIGEDEVAVVDPGPDLADHVDALIAAIGGATVSHILVTHTHRDHSPAARLLQQRTGAPTYGWGPHPAGTVSDRRVEEGGDTDFVPDVTAGHGDVIRGNAVTTLGKGDVMLKISDQGVSGTLTVGRVTVDISGDRVG